jgi:hypothetical protein
MTANYKDEQGKKLFGLGVVLFAQGLVWFKSPGLFAFLRMSERHGINNILSRAEMMIGIALAAYGMLVWRSAFRKLSLTDFITVLSCVPVLLLCVSKVTEWAYFLDQQQGSYILNELKVGLSEIMMVVCIAVFGVWWADSAFLCERIHTRTRSSRFVK